MSYSTICETVASTTTCETEEISSYATVEKQEFLNGFSYGEIIIIFLLILILVFFFFSELKNWIFGIKTTDTVRYRIFNE